MKRSHDVTQPATGVVAALGALALGLSLCSTAAADTMSKGSSPHCAANDPLVAVDAKAKTYSPAMVPTTETMKKASSGKTKIKMMCKSKADAMGAHLKQSKPHPTM